MARVDFLAEQSPGSSTLIIAFSSYGFDGDPCRSGAYEWRSVLRDFACHKLFLIDAHQHWYNGGILGYSRDLGETELYVRDYIQRFGIRRILTIGSSMGGFGALLFGALLRAEVAIAFAPQTCLDMAWILANADERWMTKMREIDSIGYTTTNLATVFAERGGPVKAMIHYDGSLVLDKCHAELLDGFEGVELFDEQFGGHMIAHEMVKRGRVTELLVSLGL